MYRSEKRVNLTPGRPTVAGDRHRLPNNFYFYGFDAEVGPFFIKFCSYFPYTAKVV